MFQIPGTKTAAALVTLGVDRHVQFYLADLAAAKRGTASWRQVVAKEDQVAEAWPAGGYLYVRTSKGAPRFRVLRMPLAKPDLANAEVVVPAGESVVSRIGAARDALYVVRRDGATQSLWRLPHVTKPVLSRIALPFEGSVEMNNPWPDVDGVVLSLGGWTRALKSYQYLPATGVRPLPLVAAGALDAPDRHRLARGAREEPRRRRGAAVDREPTRRPTRRLEPHDPLRLRRLRHHRRPVVQSAQLRLAAARRRLGRRARARRRRVRRGVASCRAQDDQAQHLEGRHRQRRVADRQWLHVEGQARHLRRQRRRHLRRPLDHRAPRPLRRRRAGRGHLRRAPLRDQRQRRRQHPRVRHREERGGVPGAAWR